MPDETKRPGLGAAPRAGRAEDEDRFRRLIANLHVGVVVQGRSAEIRVVNPAALRLLGVTEDQILGKTSFDPLWSIVREDGTDFPPSERPVATVLRTGQPVRNVVIGVNRPRFGDRVWLLVNAEPERAPDGTIEQVVATIDDITELKRLEASLLQARKMESIGRLAGGVAHDFNNLLTVIVAGSTAALEALPPGSSERAGLEEGLHAARRAAALTRQLLTFARRQVTMPRAVDLREALRGLEPLLARLIGEDIELAITAAEDTWPAYVDPVQLEQVIVNLAVNARDAMPEGGRLTISTRNVVVEVPPGEFAALTVADTGRGMDAATRERLFEPFFTTKELGTGLGLATVYGIAEKHGGFVEVESAPGRGATFTVYLRRSAPQTLAPSAQAPAPAPTAGGRETVLLVEDEPAVCAAAKRALERGGYDVLVAHDGVEAVAASAAHQGRIHVLLTDVVMPHLGGSRAAARIRAARPDIAVIFTSGYTEEPAEIVDGLFLPKPYTLGELLAAVRAAIDRRGHGSASGPPQ